MTALLNRIRETVEIGRQIMLFLQYSTKFNQAPTIKEEVLWH